MSKVFEKEMEKLKNKLNTMAATAQQMILDSIDTLVARKTDNFKTVEENEKKVNRLEIEIDDLAWKILALRQPMGTDLRFIISCLKISAMLERIADEAINILYKAEYLISVPPLKPLIDIPKMTELVTEALSVSINTLYEFDQDRAIEVCANDKIVNDLRNQVVRELQTYMQESPDNIKRALNLMFIGKSLERIGDLSTDIAEMAIYLHQGRDIRHHSEKDEIFKRAASRNKKN